MAEHHMAYFQNHTYSRSLRASRLYRAVGRILQAGPSAISGNPPYEHLAAFIRSGICELIQTPLLGVLFLCKQMYNE